MSPLGFFTRIYKIINPPVATKAQGNGADEASRPLRFGILGAANIAPPALINPAISHPEAEVYAVAARDPQRAQAYARKHGIPKVHTSYDALIHDPEIDAVYNPLPNGLHYEWTMKALEAGKHVLLEKPAANTAEETKQMFELAERKGLVLLEAFHYRFHPSIQRTKEILDSGELGKIKHLEVFMVIPRGIVGNDDIRFDYSIGGGALMDMGCYTLNCIRYLTSSNPTSVLEASHTLFEPANPPADYKRNVDRATTASLALPNDITAELTCDLQQPLVLGFIPRLPKLTVLVECEGGKLETFNFVLPGFYHSITVTPKSGRSRKEKVYTFRKGDSNFGEEWWDTYRYQLEAFVNRVKGREPQTWVTKEDSIANMEWIERIYAEKGLGSRPNSAYVRSP